VGAAKLRPRVVRRRERGSTSPTGVRRRRRLGKRHKLPVTFDEEFWPHAARSQAVSDISTGHVLLQLGHIRQQKNKSEQSYVASRSFRLQPSGRFFWVEYEYVEVLFSLDRCSIADFE
jgi:hypothetical protein